MNRRLAFKKLMPYFRSAEESRARKALEETLTRYAPYPYSPELITFNLAKGVVEVKNLVADEVHIKLDAQGVSRAKADHTYIPQILQKPFGDPFKWNKDEKIAARRYNEALRLYVIVVQEQPALREKLFAVDGETYDLASMELDIYKLCYDSENFKKTLVRPLNNLHVRIDVEQQEAEIFIVGELEQVRVRLTAEETSWETQIPPSEYIRQSYDDEDYAAALEIRRILAEKRGLHWLWNPQPASPEPDGAAPE